MSKIFKKRVYQQDFEIFATDTRLQLYLLDEHLAADSFLCLLQCITLAKLTPIISGQKYPDSSQKRFLWFTESLFFSTLPTSLTIFWEAYQNNTLLSCRTSNWKGTRTLLKSSAMFFEDQKEAQAILLEFAKVLVRNSK